jgi:hypothetical protein
MFAIQAWRAGTKLQPGPDLNVLRRSLAPMNLMRFWMAQQTGNSGQGLRTTAVLSERHRVRHRTPSSLH